MTHDSSMSLELLKQNGINHRQLLDEERNAIRDLIERERRRVRIVKWVAILAFAIAIAGPAILLLLTVLSHRGTLPSPPLGASAHAFVRLLIIVCLWLPVPALLVAGVSSILALVLSHSADRQALLSHLAQVESILRQPPDALPASTAKARTEPEGTEA